VEQEIWTECWVPEGRDVGKGFGGTKTPALELVVREFKGGVSAIISSGELAFYKQLGEDSHLWHGLTSYLRGHLECMWGVSR